MSNAVWDFQFNENCYQTSGRYFQLDRAAPLKYNFSKIIGNRNENGVLNISRLYHMLFSDTGDRQASLRNVGVALIVGVRCRCGSVMPCRDEGDMWVWLCGGQILTS